MKRTLGGMALGVIMLWLSPLWPSGASAEGQPSTQPPEPSVSSASLPACPTEDSRDCFWDAATRGNGQGRSFVDWHGTTYYPEQDMPAATSEPMSEEQNYLRLEACQHIYYFGQMSDADYLTCTRGLHADESRTSDYAWKTGNR